jgi:hypothetical protein
MQGVWIRKGVKITDPQNLWNMGVRFIYTDLTYNNCLSDNMNTCAFYGFKLGLYHRLRYPPEAGSADSQAQEFMAQEGNVMGSRKDVSFLPPVLQLEKGEPVLCETNMYREFVMTFINQYRSYHGISNVFLLRMTDDMIKWMTPTQQIVDAYPLWYHEPSKLLNFSPWKSYVYRSYAARVMAGTIAEPVDTWTAPPPPIIEKPILTDTQKIAAIRKILDS